jgi:hypothetical protein
MLSVDFVFDVRVNGAGVSFINFLTKLSCSCKVVCTVVSVVNGSLSGLCLSVLDLNFFG